MQNNREGHYSLFQAVTMIADTLEGCAQLPPSSDLFDEAERHLLDALRSGRLVARGEPQKAKHSPSGQTQQHEEMPVGLWRKANTTPDDYRYRRRHLVSYIDDIEMEYNGLLTFKDEDEPAWREIEISASSFQAWLQEVIVDNAPDAGDGEFSKPPQRKRKSIYAWPEFELAAREKLGDEGGVSGSIGFIQADLERYMTGWCERNWERQPVESVIRTRVVSVLKAFEAEKGR